MSTNSRRWLEEPWTLPVVTEACLGDSPVRAGGYKTGGGAAQVGGPDVSGESGAPAPHPKCITGPGGARKRFTPRAESETLL